jgi:preprotein translocase subunit SecF
LVFLQPKSNPRNLFYAFGGEALRGFAFTMVVGIAAGTYSAVFIASSAAILLSGENA